MGAAVPGPAAKRSGHLCWLGGRGPRRGPPPVRWPGPQRRLRPGARPALRLRPRAARQNQERQNLRRGRAPG
eukprot:8231265-Lingulodinium_polyedra.AAC.1